MSAPLRSPILVSLAVLALLSLAAPSARAGGVIIKTPKDHATYSLEIEPHLDFAFFRYRVAGFADPKHAGFGDPEFGGGVRFTIPIADPAFIPKLNDTVGITFGLDVTGCPSYCNQHAYFRIPAGIQWNFYITKEFNVFADLGFMLGIATLGAPTSKGRGVFPDFFAMAGGRYMFSDKVSLTFRVGYPFVTVGVSFFAG